MSADEKQRLIANLAAALSAVTRSELIDRSLAHFRSADADYGDRLAKAVYALREQNRDADVTVQTDVSEPSQTPPAPIED